MVGRCLCSPIGIVHELSLRANAEVFCYLFLSFAGSKFDCSNIAHSFNRSEHAVLPTCCSTCSVDLAEGPTP